MNKDQQIEELAAVTNRILADDPAYFLVEIRIRPTNNVKVFVDGDNGLPIEKCVAINRALYKNISESGMFPGDDFSLEVSSPGLEEPLKLHRQYLKNIGRQVEIAKNDGVLLEGVLKALDDSSLVVVEQKGKNKKKELIEHVIPFDQIKTTKIQIVF